MEISNENDLIVLLQAEGLDPWKVKVFNPCWHEFKSVVLQPVAGRRSALVDQDLVIRSDGTAVALEQRMSINSNLLLGLHTGTKERFDGEQWAYFLELFPEAIPHSKLAYYQLIVKVRELLTWEEYVRRLRTIS
jgi:hypothetical protein